MKNENEMREAIVAEARRWIGTPWHHGAEVRGAGVDCARLVKAAYVGAGVRPDFGVEDYPIDFMLHADAERLVETIETHGGRLVEVPKPGDVAVWRFGRSFSHAGIVVEWPARVVHAFRPWGGVVESPGDADKLSGREVRFYSLW